jgi:hypothetical protein
MPEKKDALEGRKGREIGASGGEFKAVTAVDLRW